MRRDREAWANKEYTGLLFSHLHCVDVTFPAVLYFCDPLCRRIMRVFASAYLQMHSSPFTGGLYFLCLNLKEYEFIHGILLDVKHLMKCTVKLDSDEILEMAQAIDNAVSLHAIT